MPPLSTATDDDAKRHAFQRLQSRLIDLWTAIENRTPEEHTSIVVPSLSLDPDELGKIQGVSFYEERLLFTLMRLRDPRARVVYVTSQPIHPDIVDYYLQLLVGVPARQARSRLRLFCVYDASPQPLTEKILERPKVLDRLRQCIDPDKAYLTCYNSTWRERELALQLSIPLNGVDPDLLSLGSKSGSREIFEAAGIAAPAGFNHLRQREEVVEAICRLRSVDPTLRRVVIKLDESFAGAGNAVLPLPPAGTDPDSLRERLDASLATRLETATGVDPAGFLRKLESMGGVVEEMIEIEEVRSPSVQMRINPNGEVEVVSTHDQILGGATGQTYLGCRFPADPAYRALLQEQALPIGRALRDRGVVSRFGVDFMVGRVAGGEWRSWAIEINLRMTGTTPPFMGLQFLTDGLVDPGSGEYRSPAGQHKYYYATDNLRSTRYRGLLPEDFMDILLQRGLHFRPSSETGVLFHMIGALSQFGKVGVTCIGNSPAEAEDLYSRTVAILDQETGVESGEERESLHPFDLPVSRME